MECSCYSSIIWLVNIVWWKFVRFWAESTTNGSLRVRNGSFRVQNGIWGFGILFFVQIENLTNLCGKFDLSSKFNINKKCSQIVTQTILRRCTHISIQYVIHMCFIGIVLPYFNDVFSLNQYHCQTDLYKIILLLCRVIWWCSIPCISSVK